MDVISYPYVTIKLIPVYKAGCWSAHAIFYLDRHGWTRWKHSARQKYIYSVLPQYTNAHVLSSSKELRLQYMFLKPDGIICRRYNCPRIGRDCIYSNFYPKYTQRHPMRCRTWLTVCLWLPRQYMYFIITAVIILPCKKDQMMKKSSLHFVHNFNHEKLRYTDRAVFWANVHWWANKARSLLLRIFRTIITLYPSRIILSCNAHATWLPLTNELNYDT